MRRGTAVPSIRTRCVTAHYSRPRSDAFPKDWLRHREECIPLEYQTMYNASPSAPVVASFSDSPPNDVVFAILFLPEEGAFVRPSLAPLNTHCMPLRAPSHDTDRLFGTQQGLRGHLPHSTP